MADRYVFVGFLMAFAVVNVVLVAGGTISTDWTGLGVITAVGMTLALYSFLYKDMLTGRSRGDRLRRMLVVTSTNIDCIYLSAT